MSQNESISTEALSEMAAAGSVRSLRTVQSGNGRYALVAQNDMNERTLKSQRSPVRTWASLNTITRFACEEIGINSFEVIGQ